MLNGTERRLADALTIADLRTVARKRTPRSVFDYTDGAAEAEISLRRARHLFRELEFQPSILHDVSARRPDDGHDRHARRALPFAFAPTGFTRMMNHEGERAVVRVAQRRGIPYALSTMGTTSIEDVAAAGAGRPQVVPAVRVEGPLRRRGPHGPRQGRRLRGAHAHRRRPGGRRPAARRPQRLLDPARR